MENGTEASSASTAQEVAAGWEHISEAPQKPAHEGPRGTEEQGSPVPFTIARGSHPGPRSESGFYPSAETKLPDTMAKRPHETSPAEPVRPAHDNAAPEKEAGDITAQKVAALEKELAELKREFNALRNSERSAASHAETMVELKSDPAQPDLSAEKSEREPESAPPAAEPATGIPPDLKAGLASQSESVPAPAQAPQAPAPEPAAPESAGGIAQGQRYRSKFGQGFRITGIEEGKVSYQFVDEGGADVPHASAELDSEAFRKFVANGTFNLGGEAQAEQRSPARETPVPDMPAPAIRSEPEAAAGAKPPAPASAVRAASPRSLGVQRPSDNGFRPSAARIPSGVPPAAASLQPAAAPAQPAASKFLDAISARSGVWHAQEPAAGSSAAQAPVLPSPGAPAAAGATQTAASENIVFIPQPQEEPPAAPDQTDASARSEISASAPAEAANGNQDREKKRIEELRAQLKGQPQTELPNAA